MRWQVVRCPISALLVLALVLAACSHSYRLDDRQQQLQRQQDACLARGGSPKECRP